MMHEFGETFGNDNNVGNYTIGMLDDIIRMLCASDILIQHPK